MIYIVSFLLGLHLAGAIGGFIVLVQVRTSHKVKWILYILSWVLIWELVLPISLAYSERKRKRNSFSNKTDDEKIAYYEQKIQDCNERLYSKLEAFDKLEESIEENYGVVAPKERWITGIEKWYAEEVVEYCNLIKELKEKKNEKDS